MKYIVSVESVDLMALNGDPILDEHENQAKMTFKQFVLNRLTEPLFGKTYEDVLSATRVRQCLDEFDGVLALETADWERLVKTVKAPEGAYNPLVAFNLVPFMKAVMEASDTKPEE